MTAPRMALHPIADITTSIERMFDKGQWQERIRCLSACNAVVADFSNTDPSKADLELVLGVVTEIVRRINDE